LFTYLLFIYLFMYNVFIVLFTYMFICSPSAFHFFLTSHILPPPLFVRSHSFMNYFFISPCLVSSSLTSYCEMLASNPRLIIAYHDRIFWVCPHCLQENCVILSKIKSPQLRHTCFTNKYLLIILITYHCII